MGVIFLLFFCLISNLARAEVVTPADLMHESKLCESELAKNPKLVACDLRVKPRTGLSQVGEFLQVQSAAKSVADGIRENISRRAHTAIQSQYIMSQFLLGSPPMAQESLQKASHSCASIPLGKSLAELSNIEPVDSAGSEMMRKKLVLALMEIRRIERKLETIGDAAKKKELQGRREEILGLYPMLGADPGTYTLSRTFNAIYPALFVGTSGSPDGLNSVLGLNQNDKTPAGSDLAKYMSSPLDSLIEGELRLLLKLSFQKSVQSLQAFCGLDDCAAMDMALPMAAEVVSKSTAASRNLQVQAACSCKLGTQTRTLSGKSQLALVGLTLGSAVLCPFTGFACAGMVTGSAALMAVNGADLVHSSTDLSRLQALSAIGRSIPGRADIDQKNIDARTQTAAGRQVLELGSLGLGTMGISPSFKYASQLRKVLSPTPAVKIGSAGELTLGRHAIAWQKVPGTSNISGDSLEYTVSNSSQLKQLLNYYSHLRPGLTEKTLREEIKQAGYPLRVRLENLMPPHVLSKEFSASNVVNCHATAICFTEPKVFNHYWDSVKGSASFDNGAELRAAYKLSARTRQPILKYESMSGDTGPLFNALPKLKPGDPIYVYFPDGGAFGATHEMVYLGGHMVYSKPGPGQARIVNLADEMAGYMKNFDNWIKVQIHSTK